MTPWTGHALLHLPQPLSLCLWPTLSPPPAALPLSTPHPAQRHQSRRPPTPPPCSSALLLHWSARIQRASLLAASPCLSHIFFSRFSKSRHTETHRGPVSSVPLFIMYYHDCAPWYLNSIKVFILVILEELVTSHALPHQAPILRHQSFQK